MDGVLKEQYQWTGSLSYNGLQAVSLVILGSIFSGNHNVEVRITSVNNQQDQKVQIIAIQKAFQTILGLLD